MKIQPRESEIQRAIIDYLTLKGHFVFRCNTQGTPLHAGGKITGFRPSPMRGVSDILGVLGRSVRGWNKGTFLAIECKRDSKQKTSEEQSTFLANVLRLGGMAFVATSIDDCVKFGL